MEEGRGPKKSHLLLYSGKQPRTRLIRVLGILGDANFCFVGVRLCVCPGIASSFHNCGQSEALVPRMSLRGAASYSSRRT